MNKPVLYLLLACMGLARNTYAQSITLSVNNAPLDTVFARIQSQSPYRFVYTNEELVGTKRISFSVQKAPVETVLGLTFKDQPVDYSREEQYIYVRRKQESKGGNVFVDRTEGIHGKVSDSLGSPLAGASLQVRGTKRGIQTGADGTFRLTGLQPGDIIDATFTGCLKREIKFTNQTYLSIILIRSPSPLDEVQIVAYGNVTQRYNVGNTTKVDGATIQEQPVESAINALEGRVPGLLVQSGQGIPGSYATVQLRGITSISGGTAPLYIVDGVPFTGYPLNNSNPNFGSSVLGSLTNATGLISPFNAIPPSDIDNIEVLKDATATAIYGSRGANGVILITTKKGRIGKTVVDANVYQGWQYASHIVKSINTSQFLQLDREAFRNDNLTPSPSLSPELTIWDTTKSTDYQKKILGNTSNITNAVLSISGGTAGTRFSFSGNYLKEGTIFPGNFGYTRSGGHLSVEHNSTNNRFNATFSSSYVVDQNKTTAQSLSSINYIPNYPLYDTSGKINFSTANYIALMKQISKTSTDNLIADANLSIVIFNGLKLKTDVGYNRLYINGFTVYPLSSYNPAFNPVNAALYANNALTSYIAEPQLEYRKKVQKHDIVGLIGATYQYQFSQGSIIEGQNYSNEGLFQNIGAAGTISTYPAPTSSYTQYRYGSVFGRIQYSYSDIYLLDGSFRRDGSSRFGPGKRFGDFGAIGVGIIFSNYSWVKNLMPIISYGKIRASYGTVGNDQIQDYQFLATYTPGGSYQGSSSLLPSRIANPNYSWEVTHKSELGLEMGLFHDRILFTAAGFKNRSSNQLVGYPLPTQTGFSSYQFNLPATIDNKGLEFSVNTVNFRTKHFSWSSGFTISFIDNKLVSYPNLLTSSYKYTYVVGQSLSVVKGYQYDKIDINSGLPLFRTAKGLDTIAPSFTSDQIAIGKTMPTFYGGLSNKISLYGFQLDFLLQFVKQQGRYPSYWPGIAGFTGYLPAESLERWQKPGDNTNVPLASTVYYNSKVSSAYYPWIGSNRFWGDASFLRLKNISISYSFESKIVQRAHMKNIRIYLEGQNIFTITHYPGSDPEIPSGGLASPQLRTIVAGIQLSI